MCLLRCVPVTWPGPLLLDIRNDAFKDGCDVAGGVLAIVESGGLLLGIAHALENCAKIGFHPETIRHLDVAVREFQDMKMQPPLERALRRRELLKA